MVRKLIKKLYYRLRYVVHRLAGKTNEATLDIYYLRKL